MSNIRWLGIGSVVVVAILIAQLSWKGRQSGGAGDNSNSPLVLYCAAGMRPPVTKILDAYQAEYNVAVEVEYAGSGALLSQIRAANQGDLYLAASETYVQQAHDLELIDEHAPLAKQRAVIVVRKDNPVTSDVDSLETLLSSDARITLANPDVAAVGRTTRSLLPPEKWTALWEKKLGSVDTVNLVANHVTTKIADAGIVWDTTAGQYDALRVIRVPELDAKAKQISVSVLRCSKQPTAALRLMRYMTARDRGLKWFGEFAPDVAQGDKWEQTPELLVFAGGLNRPAIEGIIDEFEKREGVSVTDSYNGCGALVGQMKGGSRPDLYFACDVTFMEAVQDLFPESFEVSGTDMVIITRKDLKGPPVKSLDDLTRDGLRVGFCSPVQSALGALTKQLLERQQLWDRVQPNIRDEPPTADVLLSKVIAGGLDAAIVYRANTTRQAEKLSIVDIDDPSAHAIQPIAVATASDHRQLAERLMARIRSKEAAERFKQLGFELREPASGE